MDTDPDNDDDNNDGASVSLLPSSSSSSSSSSSLHISHLEGENANSSSSSSRGGGGSRRQDRDILDCADADLLLLIYKYMKAKPGFSDTIEAFGRELDNSQALGVRYTWDGGEDRATINDFTRKYEYLEDTHLAAVVRQVESSKRSSSLLEKIPSKLNYKTEACKLVHLQRELHATERSIKQFEGYVALGNQEKMLHTIKLSNAMDLSSSSSLSSKYHGDENMDDDNNNSSSSSSSSSAIIGIGESPDRYAAAKAMIEDSDELQLVERTLNLNIKNVESKKRELKIKTADIEVYKRELSKLVVLPSQRVKSSHDFVTERQCGLTSFSTGRLAHSRCGFSEQSLAPRHTSLKIFTNYKHLYTISGHSGNISNNEGFFNPAYCVAFDNTNKYIITGADDYLVKVWDLNAGLLMYSCRGHLGVIIKLLVTPDNSLIISACSEGYIRFWKLTNGQCVKVLRHGDTEVLDIQFNLYTMSLVSIGLSDGLCKVWSLPKVFARDDVSATGYNIPLIDVYNINNNHDSSAFQADESGTDYAKPISLKHQRRGKAVMIRIMDVSPCGNYLVTGCEDGVARLWRFGKDAGKEGRGGGRDIFKPPSYTYGDLRYNDEEPDSPKSQDPNLVMCLEGHVSAITDVKFSNAGDRILSGSGDDGQVRIWAFKADFSASSQIILEYMKDQDPNESAAPSQSQFSRRGGATAKKPFQTQLNSLAWTCDDRRVLTINSYPNPNAPAVGKSDTPAYTRMKVWNSFNGDLLRVISTVNTGITEQLAPHPYNPALVATADFDGNIVVWDTEHERALFSHQLKNNVDDSTACRFTDLSFNNEGTMLAMTDWLGRFTLIGLDNPERFKNVLSDQYYSSDYAEFDFDLDGIAIDRGTQLPVHQSPKGVLCRIDGSAHSIQPQPFRPSTSVHMGDEEINKMIRDNIEAFREYPSVVEKSFEIYSRYQKHKSKGRKAQIWTWYDGSSSVGMPGSSAERSRMLGSSGSSPFKAFQNASSSSPFHRSNGRNGQGQGSSSSRMGSSSSSYLNSSSNIIDMADEGSDEGSDGGNSDYSSDGGRRRRRSTRLTRGDDRDHRQRSSRIATTGRTTRSSTTMRDSDDDGASDTSLEYQSDSDGSRQRKRKNKRRGGGGGGRKPTRRGNSDEEEDNDDTAGAGGKKVKVKKRIDYSRVGFQIDKLRGKPILPLGCEIDRKWLQGTTLQTTRYCPQVGDRVVYIAEGHMPYLNTFVVAENKPTPWNDFAQDWPLVMCEVTSVSYVFPNASEYNDCTSVIANVELSIIAVPKRLAFDTHSFDRYSIELIPWPPKNTRQNAKSKNIFEVALRSCELPDFLVPEYLFMRCAEPMHWVKGLHVAVKYIDAIGEGGDEEEKDYFGIVQSLEPVELKPGVYSSTPWEALHIKWYGATGDVVAKVGPWEAVPKEEHNLFQKVLERFPPPSVDESIRVAIIEAVTNVSAAKPDLFGNFQTEEGYPEDYYCIVEVPMTIGLIKNRLASNYYRQISSVHFDIDLIKTNCIAFNEEMSYIVEKASKVVEILHKIIDNPIDFDLENEEDSSSSSASASNCGYRYNNGKNSSVDLAGSGGADVDDGDDNADLGFDFHDDNESGNINFSSSSKNSSSSSSSSNINNKSNSKMNNSHSSGHILRLPVMPKAAASTKTSMSQKSKYKEIESDEEQDDDEEEEVEGEDEDHEDGNDTRLRNNRRSSARNMNNTSSSSSSSSSANRSSLSLSLSLRATATGGRSSNRRSAASQSQSQSYSQDSTATRLSRGRSTVRYNYSEADDDEEDDDNEEEDDYNSRSARNSARNKNSSSRSSNSNSNSNRSGNKRTRFEQPDEEEESSEDSDYSGRNNNNRRKSSSSTSRKGSSVVGVGGGKKRGRSSNADNNNGNHNNNNNNNNDYDMSAAYDDDDENNIESWMAPIYDRINEVSWVDGGGNRRNIKKIIVKLQNNTDATPFLQPVDLLVAPGYLKYVSEPMDISSLDNNTKSGLYDENLLEFARDALKISDNCYKYNAPESDISEMAKRLALYVQALVLEQIDTDAPVPVLVDRSDSTSSSSSSSTLNKSSNSGSSPRGAAAGVGRDSKGIGDLPRSGGSSLYAVGEKVEAIWDNDRKWYAAVVMQVTLAGSIRVRWEEGGSETLITNKNEVRKLGDKKSAGAAISSSSSSTSSSQATGRLDPELKKKMLKLLTALEEADVNEFFKFPVNISDVPDYPQIIAEPMDLQTIRRKYVRSQYKDMEALLNDVNLMLDNCDQYNEPKSGICKESKKLRKIANSCVSE